MRLQKQRFALNECASETIKGLNKSVSCFWGQAPCSSLGQEIASYLLLACVLIHSFHSLLSLRICSNFFRNEPQRKLFFD